MNEIDYLRQACQFAAMSSQDGRTQNGAVLVTKTRAIYGVNSFPAGVTATDERRAAPEKYLFIEHAERAAIYRAAALGVSTAGASLYCPWFACCDCARAIIMAGVGEVVGLVSLRNATPERWQENIKLAEKMLAEAGVGQRLLAVELGEWLRFDGELRKC
jgi:dCMP deaminase